MLSRKEVIGWIGALSLVALSSPLLAVDYSYSNANALTREQYAGGSVEYVYDNLGNRLQKTTSDTPNPANTPPTAATLLTPVNGATAVIPSPIPVLSWTPATDADGDSLTYSVYLGETTSPPLVYTGVETSHLSQRIVRPRTTYYWKVIARDSCEISK